MPISDESLNVRNFVPASRVNQLSNMLWYSVLIHCAFVGTKAELLKNQTHIRAQK